MKSLKRWIALLVVFTMVAGLGIHQFGTSLRANEADVQEPTTEAQSTEEAAVPEEPAAEETEALQDQDALVSEVGNEAEAEKAEYTITIKEPETDGGSIFAWTDGSREKVEFTGGEYAVTAEEGTTFHMEIKAKDGYEAGKVTDGSGNDIAGISADQQINITYKKVAKTADKKDSSDSKKEEAAADDDEESEPASAKAADTVLTTTVGSTVITVTAPAGALPEGAYVKAFKADSFIVEKTMEDAAEAEGKELVDYAAFNITIYDKDGVEIQPDDTVKVMISGIMVQGGEKNIYHITSEGAEKMDGTATGSTAVFNAEHFSIYVITVNSKIVNDWQDSIDVNPGDTIVLKCKQSQEPDTRGHEWEIDEGDFDTYFSDVLNKKRNQLTLRVRNDISEEVSVELKCDKHDKHDNRTITIKIKPAQPTQQTCTISFDANGGVGAPEGITGNKNDTISATFPDTVPTKTGFEFNGWNTERNGTGTVVNSYPYKFTTETTTYYAQWNITAENSQLLYFYTLVPGKNLDSQGSADEVWNGMGVGLIANAGSASQYSMGTLITNGTITEPDTFPDITVDGNVYKYAAKGTENANTKGYYTIDWIRTIVANGANEGNNKYNPTVASSTNTFHRDGVIVLNETDYCTVNFMVKEPGAEDFAVYDAEKYSKRVAINTSENSLARPNPETIDGYEFDGWYKDEACTIPAEFNGTITSNTNYYGKYVSNEYTVDYRFISATEGKTLPQSVEDLLVKPDPQVSLKKYATANNELAEEEYSEIEVYGEDGLLDGTWVFDSWDNESVESVTADVTFIGSWKYELAKTDLTVQASSNSGIYNGNAYALKNVGASVEGATIEYRIGEGEWTTESPTATNVSDSINNISVRATLKGYKTAQVDNLSITVTPKEVTIRVDDKAKVFGKKDPEFTGSVSGLIGTDTLGTITYSRTNDDEDVGVYEEVLTAAVTDLNNNYTYEVVNGDFAITQAGGNIAAITSKAEDLTKFYDGERVSVEAEASKANSTLLYSTDGETWSETNPSYTNAGSYTVYVKATHKNYKDTPVVSATIVINPRTVVMTSGSASKIYDEKPLRSDKITVTEYDEEKGEGFIKGEGAEYTFTGTQTEIGESDNTFTYTLNEGTKAVNYYITTNYGKLTVEPVPVTPGGNPAGPVSPDTVIRAVTGAPPAVAAVLGGALDNAAAAVRELITDEDEDVPLANMKGEHKCCIFHFLLMLIALIILALYTRSMKKRQEEIFELREKIDEERARRGLPPIQKK